jgi:hypothetical protein
VENNKTTMKIYSSRIITIGEQNSVIIRAIQGRLNHHGFGRITGKSTFVRTMKYAIKAYQNPLFNRF